MKKALLLITFLPAICFSQEVKIKKNIVKISLTSLAYKGISFEYERVLNQKFSVAATINYREKAALNLPDFGQRFLKWYAANQYNISLDNVDFSQLSMGNFAIAPELKYYFKNRAANGAYLSTYLKSNTYDLVLPTQFSVSLRGQNITLTYPANFSVKSYSVGLKIGYQHQLWKQLYFDIFLQEGYDAIVKITSDTQQDLSILTTDEQLTVRQKVYDTYNLPPQKFDVIVNNSGINISQKENVSALSIPFLGVNLGFAF